MSNKKTIYIAGAMRNNIYYNFPNFFKAEIYLRSFGYVVVNPAKLSMECGIIPFIYPWTHDWSKEPNESDIIKTVERDLTNLLKCDAIYLLRGWDKSIGARAEKAVAEWLNLEIIYENKEMCND